ncbi:Ligand-binding domain of nuclear hormone receptor [Cooperia oncophora]
MRRGMKKEAVQSERDRIRPNGSGSIPDDPLLDALLSAEAIVRQLRSSVITRTVDARRQATTGDVTDSMNQQLTLMVEWAKNLQEFQRLPLGSQIALLSRVAARIVDHLTTPMRQLQMNEIEYVALKAIAFFDPLAKGTEESHRDIDDTRQKLLDSFERHVRQVSPLRDTPRRFSNLLLLLPPMLAIARDLIEDVQMAKLFGLAAIDRLMQELLLPPDSSTDKLP